MNKIILGGILVTVMGGAPVVTYFLTGEKETSVEGTKENTPGDPPNCREEDGSCQVGEDNCVPKEPGKTCPGVG